ncbi:MAG TPA: rhodanese-like domain-containing protein, partial [Alphaproteobacteria bacterium]|nr:rhodanese-like domain-containing protein [Alphaproteobacteria bacterium]
VQGFDGRVGVFNHAGGACYRCLHPHPPAAPVRTCAQGGVIGALPGIVGTVQAMEAIKLIVGHESFRPLSARLWSIDARTMHTQTWTVPKRADCPVCSRPPEEIVLRYDPARCALAPIREMSCAQAAGGDVLFIDVREREEWDEGHIEGAVHLPLSALRSNPSALCIPRTEKPCVVYCRIGARSVSAAQILIRQGMGNIYNLSGGYESWRAINPP